jgi:plastocyanin
VVRKFPLVQRRPAQAGWPSSRGQASTEFPVGTTVTWTNNDSAPHTVSQNGGGFSSKVINPGETFSYTFDKAGALEYHANMKGTAVVK